MKQAVKIEEKVDMGMYRCSDMPLPSKLKLKHIIETSELVHTVIQARMSEAKFINFDGKVYLMNNLIQDVIKANV